MASEIKEYIDQARQNNIDDKEIVATLTKQGWNETEITAGLEGKPIPPKRNSINNEGKSTNNKEPVPVIDSGYTRIGFEYSLFVFTLGISAFSLGMVLHALIGSSSTTISGFFGTTLLVTAPLMIYFGNRVSKADAANPSLKHDKSRRKTAQQMMALSFGIGIIRIVFYLYGLLSGSSDSTLNSLLNMLVTVLIAGSVFIYFWRTQTE